MRAIASSRRPSTTAAFARSHGATVIDSSSASVKLVIESPPGEKQTATEWAPTGAGDCDLGLATAGTHDLALAALAPQLCARFVDEAVAVQTARRQLPAVGVQRDEPVTGDAFAPVDEWPTLT